MTLFAGNQWRPDTPADLAAWREQRERAKRRGERIDQHVRALFLDGQLGLGCAYCGDTTALVELGDLGVPARDVAVQISSYCVGHSGCEPQELAP